MGVRIGHASISENGTINGAKGDSTGKEVCVCGWYSISADFMAIHPDAAVREKHAMAVEAACANNNIGYGQGDRNTLNTLAKAVGYDLAKVGQCNCDCSSLQNVAAVASGAAGVSYGGNGWTTSSMKAALQAAGYKIVTDKAYLESADYCVRGAIYVKASSHTVCGLTNGSKAAQMLEKAGISDTSSSSGSSAAGATMAVGSIVNFTGKLHYTSASATNGKSCKPGKAKITQIYNGKHPYHLEAVSGGSSTVHGWVEAADIQEAAAESSGQASTSGSGEIKVGDIVNYYGSVHYTNSYASGKSRACKGGKAKVTQISKGKPHPYHLESAEKGCTVHGWVDADKVSR